MFLKTLGILLTSVFFGFPFWTFLWAYGKSKGWKIYYELDDIDRVAVKTTILAGIIYLISLILNLEHSERIFGEYWFGFWIYPFTYFLLPQLFWFSAARLSKSLRVMYAIWVLFVLHIEKFVIIMTSFHRSYSGEFATDIWVGILSTWLMNIGIFVFTLAFFMIIKKTLSYFYEKNEQ